MLRAGDEVSQRPRWLWSEALGAHQGPILLLGKPHHALSPPVFLWALSSERRFLEFWILLWNRCRPFFCPDPVCAKFSPFSDYSPSLLLSEKPHVNMVRSLEVNVWPGPWEMQSDWREPRLRWKEREIQCAWPWCCPQGGQIQRGRMRIHVCPAFTFEPATVLSQLCLSQSSKEPWIGYL